MPIGSFWRWLMAGLFHEPGLQDPALENPKDSPYD
jgi:hypothetical protein